MRQLRESDRQRLLEYVGKEPEVNQFFIGDIENYGMESEEVGVFAWEEESGWDCVLLKFYDSYLIYSQKEHYNVSGVAEFLKDRQVDCVSGRTDLVERLHPFWPETAVREMYLCRCDRESLREERSDVQATIRLLGQEDAPELLNFFLRIPEFADTFRYPEKSLRQIKADLEQGELAVGVFEGEELAAAAKTTASNSRSAMVTGVAARPDRRGMGYASAAVTELCRQAFGRGLSFLCLFYDNPSAGRIYHRVGFRRIGSYAMMR